MSTTTVIFLLLGLGLLGWLARAPKGSIGRTPERQEALVALAASLHQAARSQGFQVIDVSVLWAHRFPCLQLRFATQEEAQAAANASEFAELARVVEAQVHANAVFGGSRTDFKGSQALWFTPLPGDAA